jgi:hypothetical protein
VLPLPPSDVPPDALRVTSIQWLGWRTTHGMTVGHEKPADVRIVNQLNPVPPPTRASSLQLTPQSVPLPVAVDVRYVILTPMTAHQYVVSMIFCS